MQKGVVITPNSRVGVDNEQYFVLEKERKGDWIDESDLFPSREELVKEYVTLMGSDVEERGFYKELASLTSKEIVSKIIECANYYKDMYNNISSDDLPF